MKRGVEKVSRGGQKSFDKSNRKSQGLDVGGEKKRKFSWQEARNEKYYQGAGDAVGVRGKIQGDLRNDYSKKESRGRNSKNKPGGGGEQKREN